MCVGNHLIIRLKALREKGCFVGVSAVKVIFGKFFCGIVKRESSAFSDVSSRVYRQAHSLPEFVAVS